MKVAAGIILAFTGLALWAEPQDKERLNPADSREREILAGNTHFYLIRAAVGQLIHLNVDQKGADVRVRLLDPGGREIATSDLPNGSWGPEVVAVLAESAGDYQLAVAQLDPTAAPGKYKSQ